MLTFLQGHPRDLHKTDEKILGRGPCIHTTSSSATASFSLSKCTKNQQTLTLNFKNFLAAKPLDLQSGEGLRRPSPDPPHNCPL